VLLKSTGTDPRGWTAKVCDFGLSIRIDPGATHISDLFQGTITHMVRRLSPLAFVALHWVICFYHPGSELFALPPGCTLYHASQPIHRWQAATRPFPTTPS